MNSFLRLGYLQSKIRCSKVVIPSIPIETQPKIPKVDSMKLKNIMKINRPQPFKIYLSCPKCKIRFLESIKIRDLVGMKKETIRHRNNYTSIHKTEI